MVMDMEFAGFVRVAKERWMELRRLGTVKGNGAAERLKSWQG
jgi:hypothetical protein